MKNFLLGFLCFIGFSLDAQVVDTAMMRMEIDSLLSSGHVFLEERNYEKVFEKSKKALQLAKNNFGEESELYGNALYLKVKTLIEEEQYMEAEPLALELLQNRKINVIQESTKYINTLYALVNIKDALVKLDEALEFAKELTVLSEKEYGLNNLEYAYAQRNLASLYRKQYDFKKADSLYASASSVYESNGETETVRFADLMNQMAISKAQQGQIKQAEQFFVKSSAIHKRVGGEHTIGYINSLTNLSRCAQINEDFEKAEYLIKETLIVNKKYFGTQNTGYANNLVGLAGLFNKLGRYEEAEELFLEAREIIESRIGKENLDYPRVNIGTGACYIGLMKLKEAEECFREGIAILEKIGATKTEEYSNLLLNLGTVYSSYGLNKKAIEIFDKVREHQERLNGKMNTDYVLTLLNLAECHDFLDKLKEKDEYLLEAKSILLQMEQGHSSLYALVITRLAISQRKNRNFEKAEQLHIEANAIIENILGKFNDEYANGMYQTGILYNEMGKYDLAKQFYQKAKDIYEEDVYGKENDYLNSCWIALAKLYFLTGEKDKEFDAFMVGNEMTRNLITKSKNHLSVSEVQGAMYRYQAVINTFYSLNHHNTKEWLSQDSYDNALYYKGNILESSLKLEQIIRLSSDSIKNLHHQWRGYQRRIATAYSESEPDSIKLKDLEEKANQLEKRLITSSTLFEALQQQVTWDNIQANLKPKEAAIEFIHYDFYNIEKTDSTFYSALILLPNATAPIFIPLGEKQKLESLILKNKKTQQQHINGLYAKTAEKDNLYNLIWKPIEKELKGIETIYYSPSGLLHRLNLGAISIDEKEIMNERYNVVQLNSTRQLAAPLTIEKAENSAHLFGGITYNLNTDEETTPSSSADIFNKNSRSINFYDNYSELRGDAWSPLKWTDIEVQTIDLMLQDNGISTTLHTESNATEEAFYKIGTAENSPRILHLATHGYFFPDPKTVSSNQFADEPVFKTSDHPMIRSGLILAGANQAWEGKKVPEGREDGILTAYEISQMNLSNTELVVLSACETGLGDIEGNEGVYGLQRAFKIAGAKYLIMSLWQVPDFQTQELMTAFYTEWLENKKTIPDAFRTAQQQMRKKFPEPFNWAGFVLVE